MVKQLIHNLLQLLFICSAVIIASGCSVSTNISNLSDYEEIEIDRAEVFPTPEEIAGESKTVAIYDIEELNEKSRLASVGDKVTESIKKYLLEASAQIVDRKATDQYKDEVILASQQSASFDGPVFAKYLIQGKLSQVDFSLKLTKDHAKQAVINYALTQLTGERQNDTADSICRYSASVSGTFDVYSLPDLKIIKTFPFEQNMSKDTDPDTSYQSAGDVLAGIFTGSTPERCHVNPNVVSELVNDTAEDAIRKYRLGLQNLFSPKGYITSIFKKSDSKKYIAKISIGERKQLKEGLKVEINTLIPTVNSLTGNIENEERKIAEAYVTNQIGDNHAWIVFDKPEQALKVSLGDYIQVVFEKGSFEEFKDIF